jgi:hypothetical protein
MFGPERLEAIEVRVSNAEWAGVPYGQDGSRYVPAALRDLATWHVVDVKAPPDFSDSCVVRMVPR